MLIFGTIGIAITAVSVWSAIHGQNGFTEVVNMIQGRPAFVVINQPTPSGSSSSNSKGEDGAGSKHEQDNRRNDERHEPRTASDEVRAI